MFTRFDTTHRRDRRTDGHHTTASAALCIASCGKKWQQYLMCIHYIQNRDLRRLARIIIYQPIAFSTVPPYEVLSGSCLSAHLTLAYVLEWSATCTLGLYCKRDLNAKYLTVTFQQTSIKINNHSTVYSYGGCALADAGPSNWNSIPVHLRDNGLSLSTFKRWLWLNTFLFSFYYQGQRVLGYFTKAWYISVNQLLLLLSVLV